MEKENKKVKTPKVRKGKKQMPEGYIGRPKPMKTNKFEFHKPTAGFYIGLTFFVLFAAFIAYIFVRLINVGKIPERDFDFYEFNADKQPKSYILENDYLKFELDPLTTTFTVTQKNNGNVWYSNTPEADNDPIALPKEKNNMKSPFLIKYSTENGNSEVYDVYAYSVKRNFFDVSKKNNEVIVNYTVGNMEREYVIPLAIYGDEMEEWLSKMAKNDANRVLSFYHKYVYEDLMDNKQEMAEKYEGIKKEDLYLVFENLKVFQKEKAEQLFEKAGYTYEDYTKSKEIYKESNIKTVPQFNLTVVYKLDKDNLTVTVPFDEISYKNAFPIVQLSVLPYFGSAGTNDNGYIFVPEGGGSLIEYNNGKTRQNGYYADVYGWDYATDRSAVIKETRVAYPVFGMANTDTKSSFICVMENGSEYAGVTAEISGKLGSYNYVRADYKMLHSERFEVSTRNTSAQYSYEQSLPAGESIVQKYKFLDSDSYVDMAKAYRSYLFGSKKKLNNAESPLVLEIVGAVDKVQQVVGMPKTLPYKLTSYAEAADIINQIEDMGIKNANIKLSGFINGGVRQKMMSKFRFIKTLGGASGFKNFMKKTADTSATLYIDGMLQYANQVTDTPGFNRFVDPARFASSEICELYNYSPIWYGKLESMDPYFLLNQTRIMKGFDVFHDGAGKYNLAGVSYKDIGYELSANYSTRKYTSRGMAKANQIAKMKEAKDQGFAVMVNAGNDYSLEVADMITNMDLLGNNYAILDKKVPFYQIALHGYVNFTGSPVNLGYENDQIILEDAESGASLYFAVMSASERILQETNYTDYYAANFDSWKDRIGSIYGRYNDEVGKVRNACIDNHEYLSDVVTVTTYDNGYKVYVNYGYVPYTTETGLVIPAREYKVQKEAK